MNLHALDNKLYRISKVFFINDPKFINPVNQKQEREKFFKNKSYNPQFVYASLPKGINQCQKDLQEAKKQLGQEEKEQLFLKRIESSSQWIQLLKARGTQKFTQTSSKIYLPPPPALVKKAREILQLPLEKEEKTVSSQQMIKELQKALKKFPGWTAKEKSNLGAKINDSVMEKTLQVKKGETFTQKDIKRLIVHEIGVHTTRYVNGERQSYKLFVYGTAGYDETEEGLAVWNEELNQVLSRNALRNYAGRVLAIHWALQYSFSETYQKLCKYFGEQEAYHLTLRVKRGLKDTSQPGAYTKDSIYLGGYERVKKYLYQFPEDKSILFKGRIGIDDIPLLKKTKLL